MRALLGIAAMAAALMVSTSASAAPTQTATYVGGSTISVAGNSVGVRPNLPPEAGVSYGGHAFALSTKPLTLRIDDETSGAVSMGYTACQTLVEGSLACGQAGTVTQVGCTPASGTVSLTAGFVSGKPLTVFVHQVNSDCDGVATTGTIRVTYA